MVASMKIGRKANGPSPSSANTQTQRPRPGASGSSTQDSEQDSEQDDPSDDDEIDDDELALVAEPIVLDEQDFDDEPVVEGDESKRRARLALALPGRRSLAVQDPLQAYINESRKYPLLDREEEHVLAVRYREEGDLKAARRLITANLRLVVKIAHEYRKACRNLLDLVQEGNIGLMHAVKKFDPYRGVKLSSYAAWWIRAYMLKFILNNWRMVKIGTTQNQRKLFFNLRKEVERLQRLGFDNPGPKLLAEHLDVSEQEVTSMQQRLAGGDVSLDAPVGGEDGPSTSRIEMVPGEDAGPEAAVENRQFSQLLAEKITAFGTGLKGRDKEIFELRTVAESPLTLQEIGDRYGITRERARQIERRVMDRLRDYLRQELGDSVDIALGTSPPE